MTVDLAQRGRARLAFLANVGRQYGSLREALRSAAAIKLDISALPSSFAAREAAFANALTDEPMLGTSRLVYDWMALVHAAQAKDAFDEIANELTERIACEDGPMIDPNLSIPDYYRDVDFHRTEGGWSGHPEMGFVHSEFVFRRIIAASRSADPVEQRRIAARATPRNDYRNIYEMGVSSGWFTQALTERFPDAHLAGCDLSVEMLREAHRTGRRLGHDWRLRHADAAHTGEPDASVDLVASYIVFHELPASAARELIVESFRILRAGGDLMIVDFAPLGQNDPLDELMLHFGARTEGGEPWLHDWLELDIADILRDAGFKDIVGRGLGPKAHPYSITARKPA